MGEISLRYIPDLSDASVVTDLSDASFQIPRAAGNNDDLLLADDTMDFFNGMNDTLSTPAPPRRQSPQPSLTLAELTPRSKPLSTAISEELSPFRQQDPSFEIPMSQPNKEDNLLGDETISFLRHEESTLESIPLRAVSPPTLNQPTPEPSTRFQPSASASPSPPKETTPNQPSDSTDEDNPEGVYNPPADVTAIQAASCTTLAIGLSASESAHESNDHHSPVSRPADAAKGKVKGVSGPKCAEKTKKLPGGDNAKRKRVTPAAAVTKPAKLKPLTASVARRLSIGGKRPVPGMRRRPLQGGPASTSTTGVKARRVDGSALASTSSVPTDVKPPQGGGLAATLMSFGQKLMASAASPEHHGEAYAESNPANPPVPEDTVPSPVATDHRSDEQQVTDQDERTVPEPNYLTVSQLSPRKTGDNARMSPTTLASGSRQAPAVVLDQPSTKPQVSEAARPPSPMRSSIKRAGSPAGESLFHQRKRSKTTSGPSAPTSSKESAPRRPALQPSRARNAPAAAPSAGAARARRVVSSSAGGAASHAKADGVHKPGPTTERSSLRRGPGGEADGAKKTKGLGRNMVLDGDSGAHVASGSRGGRSGDASRSQRGNVPGAEERQTHDQRDGQQPIRGTSTVDKPSSNLPSAKPTRPMEFNFATSTRVDSRKGELEKSSGSSNAASLRRSKAQPAHPIPDFKTLHAMHESTLAQRKAEIVPVVPLPIGFATEARAQERERFEEARRAREAELERQREERRRQQELEEEREIKELRRRAVPKANEVPEWSTGYTDGFTEPGGTSHAGAQGLLRARHPLARPGVLPAPPTWGLEAVLASAGVRMPVMSAAMGGPAFALPTGSAAPVAVSAACRRAGTGGLGMTPRGGLGGGRGEHGQLPLNRAQGDKDPEWRGRLLSKCTDGASFWFSRPPWVLVAVGAGGIEIIGRHELLAGAHSTQQLPAEPAQDINASSPVRRGHSHLGTPGRYYAKLKQDGAAAPSLLLLLLASMVDQPQRRTLYLLRGGRAGEGGLAGSPNVLARMVLAAGSITCMDRMDLGIRASGVDQ
ncbi:hypothetical protein BD413DRAFT_490153 [Trametes elegans]|nr:hypothetical protein BD413DRAFT_490153 [Trametes elegans]